MWCLHVTGELGCPYITTLDKPCDRLPQVGPHCAFHAVLHAFETDPEKLLNATITDLHYAIGELNR
jgi:hypothetical protein